MESQKVTKIKNLYVFRAWFNIPPSPPRVEIFYISCLSWGHYWLVPRNTYTNWRRLGTNQEVWEIYYVLVRKFWHSLKLNHLHYSRLLVSSRPPVLHAFLASFLSPWQNKQTMKHPVKATRTATKVLMIRLYSWILLNCHSGNQQWGKRVGGDMDSPLPRLKVFQLKN